MVTVGLGVPVPLLAPVTATWTAPFALYLAYLSNRVAYNRIKSSTYADSHALPFPPPIFGTNIHSRTHSYLGDRAKPLVSGPSPTPPEDDPLFVATRCHANFLENVPLALVVAAIAELNGANRRVLHYALAGLFALRVAHADLGLTKQFRGTKGLGLGRILGFYGSQVFVTGVAGWAAWLVKGYWGF